jgi:hypothetical protein
MRQERYCTNIPQVPAIAYVGNIYHNCCVNSRANCGESACVCFSKVNKTATFRVGGNEDLQSSHPTVRNILAFTNSRTATAMSIKDKNTAFRTMITSLLDGGLIKLDFSPSGGGMAGNSRRILGGIPAVDILDN